MHPFGRFIADVWRRSSGRPGATALTASRKVAAGLSNVENAVYEYRSSMSNPTAEPGAAQAYVEIRRARILATVGSRPHPRAVRPTPTERRAFFVREAEELYWNELAWEQMTDEELVGGEHLTELVFPGLLALVGGLLFEPTPRVPGLPSRNYPDVVEDILTFLGERCAALTVEVESGADSQKVLYARAMTLRLLDLVLYRLYRLTSVEREEVERNG